MPEQPKRLDLPFNLKREPLNMILLTGFTIAFFLAVSGLSRIYHRQQASLASQWANRGAAALRTRDFHSAVTDFHSALLYSSENYTYRLNLAEALLGLQRTGEAYAYLINLWNRQPENGLVNLELARIAAQRGETEKALRYYHNAIYTTWPSNQEMERRNSRLELITYLLRINAQTQAQSELIALEENIGEDASQQAYLGSLFLKVQDYEHALAAYRRSLQMDSRNQPALAGAGLAAFKLGRYAVAQQYLQAALAASLGDKPSGALLEITSLVLQMDFYRPRLSIAERNRIALKAFAVAGQRLNACAPSNRAAAVRLQELLQAWTKLQPQIIESRLRRNPDLANTAMEFALHIERQTSDACSTASPADTALLLLAQRHEEN